MKGCYVYFEDAATRGFVLSRMKAESASIIRWAAEWSLSNTWKILL